MFGRREDEAAPRKGTEGEIRIQAARKQPRKRPGDGGSKGEKQVFHGPRLGSRSKSDSVGPQSVSHESPPGGSVGGEGWGYQCGPWTVPPECPKGNPAVSAVAVAGVGPGGSALPPSVSKCFPE